MVNIMDEELVIGRWYMADYGLSTVEGQCVAIVQDGAILRFRWGGPWRERKHIPLHRFIGRTADPRWITALFRFLGR